MEIDIKQRFRHWIVRDMHRTFERAMTDFYTPFNPRDVARTVRQRRTAINAATSPTPDWTSINAGCAAAYLAIHKR